MESQTIPNARVLAFNGIIAIVFGLLAIFVPAATLVSVIMYFGILIFLIGVAVLIGVINNIKNKLPYGLDLLESIVLLLIGIVLIFRTENAINLFVILIGIWAILMGIVQLYMMTKNHYTASGKNTLLVNGLISIAFGIIVLFNPFSAAKVFLILTGILAFIIGIIMIALSIMLKNAKKK